MGQGQGRTGHESHVGSSVMELHELSRRIADTMAELAELAEEIPLTSELVHSAVGHILQGQAEIARGLAELFAHLREVAERSGE